MHGKAIEMMMGRIGDANRDFVLMINVGDRRARPLHIDRWLSTRGDDIGRYRSKNGR